MKSVEKYQQKQDRILSGPKRKNDKPEKRVETEVMHWLNTRGFSCHVVESKAVFNRKAMAYISGQTVKGMTDIIGCTPEGIAVFIELKAPGKRSSLKTHQRMFIEEKIEKGCLAGVVDGAGSMEMLYAHFMNSKDLKEILPAKRKPRKKAGDHHGLPF